MLLLKSNSFIIEVGLQLISNKQPEEIEF